MSPAVSEAQRRLSCLALSIKRGETKPSFSKKAAEMAASMSEADLVDFCKKKE